MNKKVITQLKYSILSLVPISFRVFLDEICPETQNQVEVEFIL